MGAADGVEAGLRVTAALDFIRYGEAEQMREHFLWALKALMTDAPPEELSTPTLAALLAILGPEHSRILNSRKPGGGVVLLTMVRDSDAGAVS